MKKYTIYDIMDNVEEMLYEYDSDSYKEFCYENQLTLDGYLYSIYKKWIIEDEDGEHYEYASYGFRIGSEPLDGPYYELETCVEELAKEIYYRMNKEEN